MSLLCNLGISLYSVFNYSEMSAFPSTFIIVNRGDRHSFCRNYSYVYSHAAQYATKTTPVFVVSAFVLGYLWT